MRNNALIPVLAALALLPRPVKAQLLDTLLPAAIPGYGQKFSVIAEHRQFAPGATGWTLGGINAAPSLNLQTGYNSAPGGGSASAALQANPSLLIADPVAGFGLYAEGNFEAYPQDSAQNINTALVAGGERVTLPRETITLSAAFLHSAVTGFAFSTSVITSPIPFTLQNLRASDEISSGLFTLTPEVSLSRYDFSGTASTSNRCEQREGATLGYVPGGPLTALFRIGATQLNYTISSQNADIYELLAGAEDRQDGLWTFSVLAGAASRQQRYGSALLAPVLEARADWMPTDLDQIIVTASREISDPDAISSAPYTTTSIKLALTHAYLENVTVQALADFANAQYIHMNLQEFLATGELNMQWRVAPALALEGDYRYNTRQSNALSAANEHVVMLGVTWTP